MPFSSRYLIRDMGNHEGCWQRLYGNGNYPIQLINICREHEGVFADVGNLVIFQ